MQTGALLKVLQIDKRNCTAIEMLALIYFKHAHYDASMKLFMKSLEINNKSIRAYQGIVAIILTYIIEIERRVNAFKIKGW